MDDTKAKPQYPKASHSSPVQHPSLLLICPSHPGSDPLGNEQQAGHDPWESLWQPNGVATRGWRDYSCSIWRTEEPWNLHLLCCCCVVSHVRCVMCLVSYFDSQLHLSTEHLRINVHWDGKAFCRCNSFYPLQSVLVSFQRCRFVNTVSLFGLEQKTWAAALWLLWTDELIRLLYCGSMHERTLQTRQQLWMIPKKRSFTVAVFPECTSLLPVKPVVREDFGNSSCTAVFAASCS